MGRTKKQCCYAARGRRSPQELVHATNHPLVRVLQICFQERSVTLHGCSPVIKQRNTVTIARLASPLRCEDLPASIFYRPERVMGILQKVDEGGRVPSTSFVVGLSFNSRVVDAVTRFPSQMRTRITAVKRSWGHEETTWPRCRRETMIVRR